MNVDDFDRLWIDHQPDQDGMADFWNRRAPSFNAHKSQDAEAGVHRQALMDCVAAKAGLRAGSRALDIGCGTGHYALLLARHTSEVNGLDVAGKMIEFASRNAAAENCNGVTFEETDWEAVDLREKDWEKRFDLVLACKTPAVNSRASLEKMMAACRGSCCFISRVDTENSVRDGLKRFVDWDEERVRASRAFYCAFNILWLMGYSPDVWYVDQDWEGDTSLEDALLMHIRYFESAVPVRPEQREAMREALTAMAVDGRIREKIRSRTAIMFWKV